MDEIVNQLKTLNQQIELLSERLDTQNAIHQNIEGQLENIYYCLSDNPNE